MQETKMFNIFYVETPVNNITDTGSIKNTSGYR